MKKILLAESTIVAIVTTFCLYAFTGFKDEIPKTWDLRKLTERHLPPPDPSSYVAFAPENYYYSLPAHSISKTYPVYLREFEKKGYLDSLRKLQPEVIFDPARLKTQ